MEEENKPTSDDAHTAEQRGQAESGAGTVIESPHSAVHRLGTNQDKYDSRERLKTWVPIVGLIVSTCAAVASAFSACGSWAGVNATIERDRRDQRAWVGPVTTLKANVAVGSKATFGFLIKNTGKTPARQYVSRIMTKSLNKDKVFVETYPQPLQHRYATVLQPGMQMTLSVQTGGELTEEQINQRRAEEKIQYVYGEIFYQDIFDRCHRTVFCVFLLPDLTSFVSCDTYNDMIEVECK